LQDFTRKRIIMSNDRPEMLHSIRRPVAVVGWVLLLLLALRAVLTIDPYFDTFAYHLPFAGRLAGLCEDACFRLSDYHEALFAGFPKLSHELQALVWRLTGSPQAADILAVASLLLFAMFLRQLFGVPVGWTLLALLAVPLIQIHATSSYIDLPLNLAAAAVILNLVKLVRAPEQFGTISLVATVACLVLMANSKLQMLGVAGMLGGTFFMLTVTLMLRGRRVGLFAPAGAAGWARMLVFFAVGGVMVATTGIENAILFGNPFYPVGVRALGLSLPGPVKALEPGLDSLAGAWLEVPSPLRWLASVFEVDAYGYRQVPWTYDQAYCMSAARWHECWRVPAPSFRMGGYFVPYVLFLLGFLVWRLAGAEPGAGRPLVWALLLTSLLAALLPHSHELRYYLFWIVVLVALCMIAVFDPASGLRRDSGGERLLGWGCLVAVASVLLLTGGRYIVPTGPTVPTLIHDLGVNRHIEVIPDGARVCVEDGWAPFAFLFAPVFHPGREFSVTEGVVPACTVVIADEP
jgi:hypothetical protein